MQRMTVGSAVFLFLVLVSGSFAADMWCPGPMVTLFDGQGAGSNGSQSAIITITGTRNGSFCGQVAFNDTRESTGETATISELKGKDGVIPASAVKISYAHPTGMCDRKKGAMDALLDTPRPAGKTHAVWITVKVPADAKAGDYDGSLTIGKAAVPVKLKVTGWVMPEPKDFFMHVGLVESPESVALQYNREIWSDDHFKLIGKSFDQLGRVGNKTIFIPLIAKCNFGNEQTMVRWIRDTPAAAATNVVQAGDKFKHDFTPAEKYLDLYIEKVGKPKVVCFILWEIYAGGGYFGKDNMKAAGLPVSLLDPATRKVTTLTCPPYGTVESEEFWKPVLDGLHERLMKRGISDENFMVGIAGDIRPGKVVVEQVKKLAPYAKWVVHSHGKVNNLYGVPVGYISHVWGVGGQPPGWKQEWQYTVFPREGVSLPLRSFARPAAFHSIGEHGLLNGLRGFGRMGVDFWNVLGEKDKHCLIARYPETNWNQLNPNASTTDFLYAGPDGAAPTVRFEMLREGIQECEARIYIEKALADKVLRAKIGEALAGKAEAMLAERAQVLTDAVGKRGQPAKGWGWFVESADWQSKSEKLFGTAAEISAAVK